MSNDAKNGMKYEVAIPEGVDVAMENNILTMKGAKGEVKRNLTHPLITVTKKENHIELSSYKATKKSKRVINTFLAHTHNLIYGAKEGFVYKLKICSGHFPMTVKAESDAITITNFLGEKTPRVAKVLPGVQVKIEKDIVLIESADLEAAGQTAANLEKATKIKNRDRRIFQDGIYIIEKPKRVAQ